MTRTGGHTLTPSRRTVITTSAAALAGGIGSLALFAGSAHATLSASDLAVDSATHESESGGPVRPILTVDGEYSFDVESAVESWRVVLQVGRSGQDYQQIGETGNTAIANTMMGAYTVEGPITAHDDWAAGDFDAPPGETVTRTVPVRLLLEVTASDGSVVASGQATDDLTVEVTSTGAIATAYVRGSGTVTFEPA